jgi:hypothetical protein
MKTILAVLVASVVAAGLASAALAQSGSVGPDMTWEQLLEHISAPIASAASATAIAGIADATKVRFIDIAKLPGAPRGDAYAQQLQASIASSADRLAELHDEIARNSALTSKLMANGHVAEDVVAVTDDASGGFFFYLRVPEAAAPAFTYSGAASPLVAPRGTPIPESAPGTEPTSGLPPIGPDG